MSKDRVDGYVDGSWIDGKVGYGLLILRNGLPHFEAYGPISEASTAGTRQIAGELFAAGHAIRWCQTHGIDTLHLHFDYYGIEKWADGSWKARQPLTQRYRAFVQQAGVKIVFHKVAAHSGEPWNDYVDTLAKRGASGEQYAGKPSP